MPKSIRKHPKWQLCRPIGSHLPVLFFFFHGVFANVTKRITDLAAGLINFAKNSLMKRISNKFCGVKSQRKTIRDETSLIVQCELHFSSQEL